MDDDTIKRLAVQSASADIDLQVNFGNGDAIKRFARACYVEGQRDAQERIAELERDAMTLRGQRDELRILLDKRPAMNEGLREAYATWSAEVYALDIRKALNGASLSDGGVL